MVTAFTGSPEHGYTYHDEDPDVIVQYAGTRTEQRATLADISLRVYDSLAFRGNNAKRQEVDAFFRVTRQRKTAFYFRDPRDHGRTGVSLGTSVSGQTGFDLPSSGEYSRDYPISTATITVYDDGSPTGATVTVSTDARRVTLSAAPTSGSVMTTDYHAYRLVRVEQPIQWAVLAPDWNEGQTSFREVKE